MPALEPAVETGNSNGDESPQPEDDDIDLEAFATIDDDPDAMAVEEVSKAVVAKVLDAKKGPLIPLEEATAKIGQEILDVLDERFKGTLTEVRHPDALDRLF
ncbi:MAG: hypothetical protein ACSHX4_05025 [Opitutaceae bacterium]